jgi:hypothetical protein
MKLSLSDAVYVHVSDDPVGDLTRDVLHEGITARVAQHFGDWCLLRVPLTAGLETRHVLDFEHHGAGFTLRHSAAIIGFDPHRVMIRTRYGGIHSLGGQADSGRLIIFFHAHLERVLQRFGVFP